MLRTFIKDVTDNKLGKDDKHTFKMPGLYLANRTRNVLRVCRVAAAV